MIVQDSLLFQYHYLSSLAFLSTVPIFKLLQASNDSQYKYSTEEEDPISFIRRVQTASEDKSINCQKYFASRFQIFLVNLMELKSTPRDEKSVHAFSSYFL